VYESDATDDGLTNSVRACLQKLPDTEREVLLLTAWEGPKPRQIVKVTGSTANLVRVRLHHARQRLAAELSPEEPAFDRPRRARIQAAHQRAPMR
jgi:RNA polymerase sigma-70 factor (ECF subfamily)